MPVKSTRQWALMGAARSGKVPGLSPDVAKEFMDATPPEKRKQFARASAKKRGKKRPKKAAPKPKQFGSEIGRMMMMER